MYTNGPRYDEEDNDSDSNPDSIKTVEMLGVREGLGMLYTGGYCSDEMNGVSPDTESEREDVNTESVNWVPYSGT